MAWIATLAPILGGCLLAGGAVAAMHRARRGRQEYKYSELIENPSFDPSEFKALDPSEVEQAAGQALNVGNVELAATMFERAGMLLRAMELYRRVGNISKVAELEITSLELGRSAVMPVLRIVPASDAAMEDGQAESKPLEMQPLMIDAIVLDVGDDDLEEMRETLPPTAKRIAPLEPKLKSERPRAVEVKRMSERPRNAGPSIESLKRMLGSSPTPDLGNIEIFYRLALAYLANGQRDEARKALLTVEEVSPGYRDTGRYIEQLGALAPAPVPAEVRIPMHSGPIAASPVDVRPLHSSPVAKKRGYIEETSGRRSNRMDER